MLGEEEALCCFGSSWTFVVGGGFSLVHVCFERERERERERESSLSLFLLWNDVSQSNVCKAKAFLG